MRTISSTDIVFATVSRRGTTLYNGRLSGVSSIDEVLGTIRRTLAGVAGICTLSLRNGSQGWTSRTSIAIE